MNRRELLQAGLAATGTALAQTQQQPKRAAITSSVMLWTLSGSLEERLEAAAKAGLQSVELVAEHVRMTDVQRNEFKRRARSLRLGIDTIIATPDWKTRPVSMVRPEQREAFLADVRQAIGFAQSLEVPQVILMSGDEVPGRSREEQYAALVEATKRAGDLAAKANLTMIVEPLNSKVNHKDFFLTTNVEGLRLMRDVDNPHVKLLFDIYHEQVQIGNVIRTLTEAMPHVAVFHVADNPGRNDPGTGEIHWPNVYGAIRKAGYGGYVCMEYRPLGEQVASLTKAANEMRAAIA